MLCSDCAPQLRRAAACHSRVRRVEGPALPVHPDDEVPAAAGASSRGGAASTGGTSSRRRARGGRRHDAVAFADHDGHRRAGRHADDVCWRRRRHGHRCVSLLRVQRSVCGWRLLLLLLLSSSSLLLLLLLLLLLPLLVLLLVLLLWRGSHPPLVAARLYSCILQRRVCGPRVPRAGHTVDERRRPDVPDAGQRGPRQRAGGHQVHPGA